MPDARDDEIAFLREHIRELTGCLKPLAPANHKIGPVENLQNHKPKLVLDPEVEQAIKERAYNDATEAANRRLAESLVAKGATSDHIVKLIRQGGVILPPDDSDLYAVA